ncbi:MAG: rRNA maturation RNase YbeY [Actinobacteria bacterium HGW-Actinobacteria-1]|jgi:probable rRNA maturation factor|nr:MAG: rRNA maturation RNase YbeY [Actinobacteria bacterium HGW-Actinobacteria-1]
MLVSVTSHREPEPLNFEAFERLAHFALGLESAPEQSELSIALVDIDEMARLNEQYRGIVGPTDVLSFGCDDPCVAAGDEPITLGDVIIAPEVAAAQAVELGTTVESELNLLLVHGILHLLGYDHETDEDASVMQAREVVLLEAYAAE